MLSLVKYVLAKNKWNILFASLMLGTYTVLRLFPAAIIERFINKMSNGFANPDDLTKLAVFYFTLTLLIYVADMAKNYSSRKIAWRITDYLRVKLLVKSVRMGQSFYNQYGVGDIIENLDGDINVLETFVTITLVPVLVDTLSLISVIAVFFYTNVVLGLCFTVFCLITFLLLFFMQRIDSDAVAAEREARAGLASFWAEVVLLRKEIKLLRKEQNIFDRINTLMTLLKHRQIRKQRYLYRIWTTSLFTLALGNVISLLIGGSLLLLGVIKIGTVFLVYSYSNMLKSPMEQMQYHLQNWTAAKSSYTRLCEMYEFDDCINDGELSVTGRLGTVQVMNVSHQFGGIIALRNINFELRVNEKLGIIGESGSGKSTISKLICKMYPLQVGEIYLFGKDIRKICVEDLRRNIAYVTASEQVFSDTLKNNLDMRSLLTNEEIEDIIRKHRLEKFFHTYEGYSISEKLENVVKPERLSVGERQILNMLRLFFCDKKIVIFDEAIANVDQSIEEDFFDLFDLVVGQRTTIMITHNVERLAKCDMILALANGEVVEYGTPQDLMNNIDSMYYRYSRRRWM